MPQQVRPFPLGKACTDLEGAEQPLAWRLTMEEQTEVSSSWDFQHASLPE